MDKPTKKKRFIPWGIIIYSVSFGPLLFWRWCSVDGVPEKPLVIFLIFFFAIFIITWAIYLTVDFVISQIQKRITK